MPNGDDIRHPGYGGNPPQPSEPSQPGDSLSQTTPSSPFTRVHQFVRNLNNYQFGSKTSGFTRGVGRVLDAQQKAKYFRTAGMGAALRYTLGMPQQSEEMNNLYRARLTRNLGTQPGRNPDSYQGTPDPGGRSTASEFGDVDGDGD